MCFGFNRATYCSFSLELSSSSSQLFIFQFLFYGDGDVYERRTYATSGPQPYFDSMSPSDDWAPLIQPFPSRPHTSICSFVFYLLQFHGSGLPLSISTRYYHVSVRSLRSQIIQHVTSVSPLQFADVDLLKTGPWVPLSRPWGPIRVLNWSWIFCSGKL